MSGQLSAQAGVNSIVQRDEATHPNAVHHSFDPEASPQEKAAQAGKAANQLKSVTDTGPAGKELVVDGGKNIVVPTITVEDHDHSNGSATNGSAQKQVANDQELIAAAHDGTPTPPGAMPEVVAPVIPDWYKVGWRAIGGIDKEPLTEGEEHDKGVLDLYLSEQYYGTWYHNAGLIVFAVFVSHFLTRFHFGWGWLFIILAVCNTYYSTSMERVRRRARDDIQRELVKTRLLSEHESADWINNFLDRFWLIYEPVLSRTIVSSVDQILSTNTPAFLDSLRLTDFTLGTKAPRIDKVRTFPKTPDDIVMMDWGISFTPNDVSDITPRQAATKVNPKVILAVRLGKGLATATMPILVENITFSGLMRIKMKLMTNFPHVQVVDISFLEKPVIDYVLKPIGGETFGFDIANIPGLSSFIRDMTHATLGPMMYDPNAFTLNLEQLLSGTPLDTAIGVLQITIQSARGIKGTKIGGGTPDPFVSLSIENRAELARTKYKSNTYNPTWTETKFLLVNTLAETLTIAVFDYNDHRKDTLLGSASFELAKLQDEAEQQDIHSPILKDGKDRGEIRYDMSWYPVLPVEEGKEVMETTVGIVRLTIHQAKDLDHSKVMGGDLNPFAKVYLGSGEHIHTTSRFKHTVNPVWESPKEFLCSSRESSIIMVKVIDDRDFLKDPVIGYMSIKLQQLLDARKEAKDWWPLSGCKSGKIRISAEWKPLSMAGSLHGADQYTPPIGAVRLHLQKAVDVKNVEAALGGKSDPYIRVQVGNVTKGRTEVVNNNLSPVWNQIIYIPVHSLRENLLLECMDYQHLTKDRSLGSVELRVNELARKVEDIRFPYESTGIKTAQDHLRLDKGGRFKGELHYTAQFVPALALNGVEFQTSGNALQRTLDNAGDEGEGSTSKSVSSASDDDAGVPEGVTVHDIPKGHKKGAVSTDTTKTAETAGSAVTAGSKAPVAAETGVTLSKEELLKQQSGIIVFNVTSGRLSKKARLEVLLDDGYWPAFSTVRARNRNAQWDYVGEGFVKELDFSRVWLRLNDAEEGDKDEIVAEWKGDAKAFLESALDGPQTFTLTDHEEKPSSTVEIEARYVPAPVQLEPRESINNQGVLNVNLIDGREITGVDRGGKSDPFAVFTLNGTKVYKSQTKKKTLTPDWQESFVIGVPSRVDADFTVEIFDWNQIEQAKSLGSTAIDLSDIEPFQAQDRTLTLHSAKHGNKGEVRVRLMFQPEIIAKSRKNTSTFSAAGRAMTQIGGLPVGAGKGVVHGVTGVFKKGHGKEDPEQVMVSEAPAGQASRPLAQPDGVGGVAGPIFPAEDAANGHAEPGTLRVTIIEAKDLSSSDVKPYVVLRVGDREQKTKHVSKTAVPEWNESFNFPAGSFTPKVFLWVHDHKTIGKDKLLGDAEIDIWRHIKSNGSSAAEVACELQQGTGLLKVRLEFDADSKFPLASSGSSVSSHDRTNRTISMSSPSRFSLRGRRPGAENDE